MNTKLRKSERLRLLELEVVRLSYEIQYLSMSLGLILEGDDIKRAASEINLDAGKWYQKKAEKDE